MSACALDDGMQVFLSVRDRLFGIAFRILNDCGEAEDAVQETWLRWQMCDRSGVADPGAYLATTTKRLCLNVVQSARARHESCCGSYVPEPADAASDPQHVVERSAEWAFIAPLLERLSSAERAAFVLREAFDYAYADIAGIVGVSQANARQLVSRARRRLAPEDAAVAA